MSVSGKAEPAAGPRSPGVGAGAARQEDGMLRARGRQKGVETAKAAAGVSWRVRAVAVIATAVALAGVLVGLPASASAATPITKPFSHTGGVQTSTAPNGVTAGASAGAAATRQRACPTFRVLRPGRAAGYRAGVYDLSVSGPVSCRGARGLFRRYLRHPDSRLPRGWRHRRHYAGFVNRRAAFNVYQPFQRSTHHRFGAVRLCHPAASVFPRERVGFRPGHHALLAWGKTPCARARAVFRSYARRGVVPSPYRLDRNRTAFSAGRSGIEVAYRDYALRDRSVGNTPDNNDQCAKGQFDFYICGNLENRLAGITLANGSESHSCGGTATGPAQTLAPFTSTSWSVYCAIGFWGSLTYDIIYQGGPDGQLVVSYTTFYGTYSCQAVNSTLEIGCNSGSLIPENENDGGENWHYLFYTTAG
jgi:hypothetical protein